MTDQPLVALPQPRWRRLLRPVLTFVALGLVFGWILPQFIDYAEVWQAMSLLDGWEMLLLVALALSRVPSEALMYRAFLPRLRLWRGSQAFLSSNFASQLLPPPSASIVQYRYFRGEGFQSDTASLAAAGSFLFPMLGRFLLPPAALVVLLAVGEVHGTVVVAATVALTLTGALALLAWVLLRTDQSARWLGARVERPLGRLLRIAKRTPVDDAAQTLAGCEPTR